MNFWVSPASVAGLLLFGAACSSSSQELFPEALRETESMEPTVPAPGARDQPLPTRTTSIEAMSIGTNAEGAELLEMGELELAGLGAAQLRVNGQTVFWGTGGVSHSSRGIHVAVIDPNTGDPLRPECPQPAETRLDCTPAGAEFACSFDLFCGRLSGELDETRRLTQYLRSVRDGQLVVVLVADDGGLTRHLGEMVNEAPTHVCDPLETPADQQLRQEFAALGAQELSNYCYRDSWVLIAEKGGELLVEQLDKSAPAFVSVALPVSE